MKFGMPYFVHHFKSARWCFESNRNIVETPISQECLLNRKIMLILARWMPKYYCTTRSHRETYDFSMLS